MKAKTNQLGMLAIVMGALVALPAASAWAGDRDDHGDRDGRHGRPDGHGGFSVQFGLGRPGVVQRWVPGHYVTRIERVLVEEGHYETRTEQVLVAAGRWEDRCVPAVVETHRDYRGRVYTIVVAPARTERVWVPPVYETRVTRVWCPPRYEDREVRVWVAGCYVAEPVRERPLIALRGVFGW